jgi:peptidoglycan/LPS O-acetylase OafA/YrhL
MRRVPELDALRAIAATVVLLFHLDPGRYFLGWSGVDLFFVLSGYLITAIILKNLGSPGFYKNFYARRSLRIWPIYYLTLVALLVANPFLAKPAPLNALPYFLTYTQNCSLYWGKQPPPFHPAFDHTWTLAIEEQFYLIWPALVIWAGRRRLVPLCLTAVFLAMASREGWNCVIPQHVERLLISRCDGFALGGLLAAILAEGGLVETRPRACRWGFLSAAVGSLGFLVWGSWAYGAIGFIGLPTPSWPAETIFAFGLMYAGVIGLVVCFAGHRWLWPLRLPPLVYVGQISYGLYLYHYVIYWAIDGARVGKDYLGTSQPWRIQATKLAVSLVVAVISWHLIERPILGWKDRFRYREPVLPPANLMSRAVSEDAGR